MQITIDTNNLSEMDIAMLAFLANQAEETEEVEEETPAPKPTKKASAKAAAPAKKDEPEDLVGGGPTMSDAVAAATQLVSSGEAAKVKTALAEIGAKRVSEMKEEDIPAFLAALEA